MFENVDGRTPGYFGILIAPIGAFSSENCYLVAIPRRKPTHALNPSACKASDSLKLLKSSSIYTELIRIIHTSLINPTPARRAAPNMSGPNVAAHF